MNQGSMYGTPGGGGRGRGRGRGGHYSSTPPPQSHDGADPSSEDPGSSSYGKTYSCPLARGRGPSWRDVSQHHENVNPSGSQGWSMYGVQSDSYRGSGKQRRGSSKPRSVHYNKKVGSLSGENGVNEVALPPSSDLDRSFLVNVDPLIDGVSRTSEQSDDGNENLACDVKGSKPAENLVVSEDSRSSILMEPFDICPPKSGSLVTLKPSLLAKNREKRNEMKRSVGGTKGIILRSGMVLLKNYLSSNEQATILRICSHHGCGPAGFYQPCFHDGGKLHLKLMCFGAFWDPETNKYGQVRPIDGLKPLPVPKEFMELVDRAIKASHSLIAAESRVKNVEEILPLVKPDICLVNYYASSGKLGLHQDKDESRESLEKGLPIVSFSIGDSAEFLYGDERDAEKAEKVVLESGDVLIFGGKARHIFHGVSKIMADTAPKTLLEETNFRPGRLNLTFRQYL